MKRVLGLLGGIGLALVAAYAPATAHAQSVQACSVPWLDVTRLTEVLRIEVGEVDATFRVDECTAERALVSVEREGRTLAREVPWADTPDALRVRLIAIVLAELLHTDNALREQARRDHESRQRAGATATQSPGLAAGDPARQAAGADGEGAALASDADDGMGTPLAAAPPLVLEAQIGMRIFPPLPLPFADDDIATLDVGLGVQWRRLVVRGSVLVGSRRHATGNLTLRAYLATLGVRLLDAAEDAWRLQVDLLTTLGMMQARGHFDPNLEAGGLRRQATGGLALGLGIAHDRARARLGFRCELGYLKGMRIDQGGSRAATLDGWNIAFYLSVGLRVNEAPRLERGPSSMSAAR